MRLAGSGTSDDKGAILLDQDRPPLFLVEAGERGIGEAPSGPLFDKFDTSKNDALDWWHKSRVAAIERAALRGRKQAGRLNQDFDIFKIPGCRSGICSASRTGM